jgi:hypothetical protein
MYVCAHVFMHAYVCVKGATKPIGSTATPSEVQVAAEPIHTPRYTNKKKHLGNRYCECQSPHSCAVPFLVTGMHQMWC